MEGFTRLSPGISFTGRYLYSKHSSDMCPSKHRRLKHPDAIEFPSASIDRELKTKPRCASTHHHPIHPPPGASRLVQATSACSVKTRRGPSRHCRDARVNSHTTTAIYDGSTPPPVEPTRYRCPLEKQDPRSPSQAFVLRRPILGGSLQPGTESGVVRERVHVITGLSLRRQKPSCRPCAAHPLHATQRGAITQIRAFV